MPDHGEWDVCRCGSLGGHLSGQLVVQLTWQWRLGCHEPTRPAKPTLTDKRYKNVEPFIQHIECYILNLRT